MLPDVRVANNRHVAQHLRLRTFGSTFCPIEFVQPFPERVLRESAHAEMRPRTDAEILP